MSGILQRYVFRETLQTWLVVTVVLLVILVTNQFAAVLGDAAANKLPRGAILYVGSDDPRKNLRTLAAAYLGLTSHRRGLDPLVLVGPEGGLTLETVGAGT